MRVLVTGNMGYVGSVLARYLKNEDHNIELIGYDTGFFGHLLTAAITLPETLYSRQIFGDVRDITYELLLGIDVVIHLAAVSNDPMGNEFQKVTDEINRTASVNLARIAAGAGTKTFVFASSCSMYGQSEDGARKETDPTNPLTAYARSKIGTEKDLKNADLGNMVVTSLRFATACGMSDRLRLDLVLNDFVACAITSGEITVLSDGSPWRPLIDVEDMARAIFWAMSRTVENGGAFLAINTGCDENNYQVTDLAESVASHIPGTTVSINKNAPPDNRSYKVDFSLYKSLAPGFMPKITLNNSILKLKSGLKKLKFDNKDFRKSNYIRLNILRKYFRDGIINENLRWE